MLRNKDFIVFSDDWGRHPSSCQHIMKHFLPENRIVWVNTIGVRSPQLTAYDIKRSLEKILSWVNNGKAPEHNRRTNPVLLNPLIIPYNQFDLIRRFNKKSVINKVGKHMAAYGIEKPVVLTTFPNTADYVRAFGEAVHIYYCVDDFTNWPGVDKKLIKSMEDSLIERCDIVFATSRELCIRKERNGKKPVLLFHGVDFEHFNMSRKEDELTDIPKPIIGFFGAVSSWLDFNLIKGIASKRPEWSFVFLGAVDTDVSLLAGIRNIYLNGMVPYEKLPSYAAAFDVGIIPFQVNELTASVNPLKLLEYLACGLPVVSTALPEVLKFSDVVYIAENAGGFISAIEKALSENSGNLKSRRVEIAKSYSWAAVAERLNFHIESYAGN